MVAFPISGKHAKKSIEPKPACRLPRAFHRWQRSACSPWPVFSPMVSRRVALERGARADEAGALGITSASPGTKNATSSAHHVPRLGGHRYSALCGGDLPGVWQHAERHGHRSRVAVHDPVSAGLCPFEAHPAWGRRSLVVLPGDQCPGRTRLARLVRARRLEDDAPDGRGEAGREGHGRDHQGGGKSGRRVDVARVSTLTERRPPPAPVRHGRAP